MWPINSKRQQGIILLGSVLFSRMLAAVSVQNVVIQADHMKLYLKKNETIYRGHVVIQNQTVRFKGNKIIVQRDKNGAILAVLNDGTPAYYFKQPESVTEKPVTARAHRIEFYPQKHLAILEGKAFLQQGEDIIQAPLIHYNTQNQLLTASSGQKNNQIHMNVIFDQTK